MKAKEYNLIYKCVEDGIEYGWNRAHKHVEDPEPQNIKDAIHLAIMNELCEWFTFEEDYKDEI